MKIDYCEQLSPEWFAIHKGKIGGKMFGQVISGKKNRLIYELLNQHLNEYNIPDEYVDEKMQFGIDNEETAIELYSKFSGLTFIKIGCYLSETSPIHMASPDGITPDFKIVLEIKCTMDGSIHMQRFFEGPETTYMPQIKNYFAVDDTIEEVHWVSYCPMRSEKPLVFFIFKRKEFESEINKGRELIKNIEKEIEIKLSEFTF